MYCFLSLPNVYVRIFPMAMARALPKGMFERVKKNLERQGYDPTTNEVKAECIRKIRKRKNTPSSQVVKLSKVSTEEIPIQIDKISDWNNLNAKEIKAIKKTLIQCGSILTL